MEQRKRFRSVIRWATIVSLVCAGPVSASGPDRLSDQARWQLALLEQRDD